MELLIRLDCFCGSCGLLETSDLENSAATPYLKVQYVKIGLLVAYIQNKTNRGQYITRITASCC